MKQGIFMLKYHSVLEGRGDIRRPTTRMMLGARCRSPDAGILAHSVYFASYFLRANPNLGKGFK